MVAVAYVSAHDPGESTQVQDHAPGVSLIEAQVIHPVLAGRIPLRQGVDAIASARTAALVDPEGEGLAKCLAEITGQTAPAAIAAE